MVRRFYPNRAVRGRIGKRPQLGSYIGNARGGTHTDQGDQLIEGVRPVVVEEGVHRRAGVVKRLDRTRPIGAAPGPAVHAITVFVGELEGEASGAGEFKGNLVKGFTIVATGQTDGHDEPEGIADLPTGLPTPAVGE